MVKSEKKNNTFISFGVRNIILSQFQINNRNGKEDSVPEFDCITVTISNQFRLHNGDHRATTTVSLSPPERPSIFFFIPHFGVNRKIHNNHPTQANTLPTVNTKDPAHPSVFGENPEPVVSPRLFLDQTILIRNIYPQFSPNSSSTSKVKKQGNRVRRIWLLSCRYFFKLVCTMYPTVYRFGNFQTNVYLASVCEQFFDYADHFGVFAPAFRHAIIPKYFWCCKEFCSAFLVFAVLSPSWTTA